MPWVLGITHLDLPCCDDINNNEEVVGYGTYGGDTHAFALLNNVPEPRRGVAGRRHDWPAGIRRRK